MIFQQGHLTVYSSSPYVNKHIWGACVKAEIISKMWIWFINCGGKNDGRHSDKVRHTRSFLQLTWVNYHFQNWSHVSNIIQSKYVPICEIFVFTADVFSHLIVYKLTCVHFSVFFFLCFGHLRLPQRSQENCQTLSVLPMYSSTAQPQAGAIRQY